MRKAMRLHGNKCVPSHAVPVLVGIDVSEVDAAGGPNTERTSEASNPAGLFELMHHFLSPFPLITGGNLNCIVKL